MPLMRGCFAGSVTSLGPGAADCTGCFQKETGARPSCPCQGPGLSSPGKRLKEQPPPAVPRALGLKRTFWHACVNCEMDFPDSTPFNEEHRHSPSRHIFPSCACAFLDDDPAYEGYTNPLTGSLPTCRRSPRLLSNGYYVLREDSFLSDEEGNITLTPSHTSVTYKENLFRVFRRRKKIRRSLDSLFNLSASSSWLSSTIPSRMDFSHVEEPWPDGCSKLEASHGDIGDSDFSSEYNNHVSQRQIPASSGAFLTKDGEFLHFEEPLCASKSFSSFMINANEENWSNAESRTVKNVVSHMVALIMCLIISVCTRYFLGGLSATLLLIILV
ncbi:transmembrane protein 71 isoform X4 [Lonchura striata]